jgi:hypothetical protein
MAANVVAVLCGFQPFLIFSLRAAAAACPGNHRSRNINPINKFVGKGDAALRITRI